MPDVTKNLGRVSIVPKGAYSAEETYDRLNLVRHDGSAYLSRKDSLTGVDPEDGENWMLMAERGAPGGPGTPGPQGVTFTPSVSEDGVLSWSNDGEMDNPESVNIRGPQGAASTVPGPAGVSPTVTTERVGKTTTVTITDAEGPHEFEINDGADGTGAGDMTTAVYDPGSHQTDVFAYADKAAKEAAESAVQDVSAGSVKFDDGQSFQDKLDAGELTGPAGKDGAPGEPGAPGAPGDRGPAGPNEISESTATDIDGLLKGNGATVEKAQAGVDYLDPAGANEKYLPKADPEFTGTLQGDELVVTSGAFGDLTSSNKFNWDAQATTRSGQIKRDDYNIGIVIKGLVDPAESYDAAHKKYVDDLVGDIGTILDEINGKAV